jgi:hypothetical protein
VWTYTVALYSARLSKMLPISAPWSTHETPALHRRVAQSTALVSPYALRLSVRRRGGRGKEDATHGIGKSADSVFDLMIGARLKIAVHREDRCWINE